MFLFLSIQLVVFNGEKCECHVLHVGETVETDLELWFLSPPLPASLHLLTVLTTPNTLCDSSFQTTS